MYEREWQRIGHMSVTAAPENVLDYFAANTSEAMEEIACRIIEELGRIGIDASPTIQAVGERSMWRAQLIVGLAQRSGTLSSGHLDVAVAIELMKIAFDTHLIATDDALRGGTALATLKPGHLILAGDYYLTRAAIAALRSDRLTTLGAVAAIMRAIPTGRVAQLGKIKSPVGVVRWFRQSHIHLYHTVVVNCFRASLSESGLVDDEVNRGLELATWTALAISARRDWVARAMGPRSAGCDLPWVIALRTLPVRERINAFASVNEGNGKAELELVVETIQRTGALEACGKWAQWCSEKAGELLNSVFPTSETLLHVAPPEAGASHHVT